MVFPLGRRVVPPSFLSRRLFLRDYDRGLPEPPAVVDGFRAMGALTMAGNDRFGDCVYAAAAHLIELWTANATRERVPSDSEVVDLYLRREGGNNGAALGEVLPAWQKEGLWGDRIGAYVAIDAWNTQQLLQGVWLFGGLFCGMWLPTGWADDLSGWTVANRGRGYVGGHCVDLCAYDQTAQRFGVYTWGRRVPLDFSAVVGELDEVYAILSPDWYEPGKCPNGLDVERLRADLAALQAS